MLGSLVYHYQISFKEDLGPIKLQGEKFYNKPILAFEEKFQKVVVNQEDFEGGGSGSGLHFYIAMTLGEYKIRYLL